MKHSSTFKNIRNGSSFAVVACMTALSMCTLTVPQAHGFGGGGGGNPFGNGSFFSTEGTFQATIRGTNGVTGQAIFSTSSTGTGGGIFTINSEGKTYTGNVNASISGNTLAVSLEASLPGTGTGSSTLVVATSNLTVVSKEIVYGGNTTQTVSKPDQVTTIGNRTITQNQTNFVGGLTTNTTAQGLTTNTTVGGSTTNTTVGGLTTNTTVGALTTNTTQIGFSKSSLALQQSNGNSTYNVGQIIVEGDQALTIDAAIIRNQTLTAPATITTVTTTPTAPASVSTSNQTTSVSTTDRTTSVTTTPGAPASVSTSNQTTSLNSSNYDSGQVTTTTGGNTTTFLSQPDQITEKWGIINTVADTTYNDVDYAAGSFTASLYNSFPNQAFDGSGTMTFQSVDTSSGVPQLTSTVSTITVSGTRTSNTAGVYTPVQVDIPRVYTTYSKELLK
jgi:hypothetical protein